MKTYTFTVDNVGNPEPVTVQTVCRRVEIGEDDQAGTTDYKIHQPTATDPAVTYPAGKKKVFEASPGTFYTPSQIIAYVETVSGSVTFSQEES